MHSALVSSSTRLASTSGRTSVVPRANPLNDAADGMVRIFSPPTSTLSGVKRMEGSYTGEKHHARKSGPFRDGFSAKPVVPVSEVAVAETSNVAEYLGKSLQAMVAKNFSRKSEEPEWMNAAPKGYSGPSKRGHGHGLYGSRK